MKKKDGPKTDRTSISLLPAVMAAAKANAARRGFGNSFSGYLAWLIERDCEGAVDREQIDRKVTYLAAEAEAKYRTDPKKAPARRAGK